MNKEIYIKNEYQCSICGHIIEETYSDCSPFDLYDCKCSTWKSEEKINNKIIHGGYDYSNEFSKYLPINPELISVKVCSFCYHPIIIDKCYCSSWNLDTQQHLKFNWKN